MPPEATNLPCPKRVPLRVAWAGQDIYKERMFSTDPANLQPRIDPFVAPWLTIFARLPRTVCRKANSLFLVEAMEASGESATNSRAAAFTCPLFTVGEGAQAKRGWVRGRTHRGFFQRQRVKRIHGMLTG